MSSMFEGQTSLISFDLKNFETKKVSDINNLFYNCSNLSYIGTREFDSKSFRYYLNAFTYLSIIEI